MNPEYREEDTVLKSTAESTGNRKRTSPAKKTGRTRKAADSGDNQPTVRLSEAERQRYIAEAAYYLAEKRGFESGSPEADWLAAEAEIDHMLTSARHFPRVPAMGYQHARTS